MQSWTTLGLWALRSTVQKVEIKKEAQKTARFIKAYKAKAKSSGEK